MIGSAVAPLHPQLSIQRTPHRDQPVRRSGVGRFAEVSSPLNLSVKHFLPGLNGIRAYRVVFRPRPAIIEQRSQFLLVIAHSRSNGRIGWESSPREPRFIAMQNQSYVRFTEQYKCSRQ